MFGDAKKLFYFAWISFLFQRTYFTEKTKAFVFRFFRVRFVATQISVLQIGMQFF